MKNLIILLLTISLLLSSSAFALDVSVTNYGAKGNGINDDRIAIQSAIDAVGSAGGGTVTFPAGVYLITAPNKAVWSGEIVIKSNVRLQGAGKDKSIIKMADNQGVWDAMFWDGNNAVNNFSMYDLGMNGNGATNQNMTKVTESTAGQLHTQVMFGGYLNNAMFKRCHFYNNSGVWCIFIPNGLSNVTVDSCVFDTIGGFTTQDYDHSSIYTTGSGPVMVSNNIFATRNGPGTKGCWAAIEIHGSHQKVINNKISGYYTGINVVADGWTAGSINPAHDQQYINNTITGISSAFCFWSRVDSAVFKNNDIVLETKAWNWLFAGKTRSAFQFNPVAGNEPIYNMKILNNRITYTNIYRNNYLDAAISLNTVWFSGPTPSFKNLTISGNKITSSISSGILILGNVNNGDISNDTLINPAYTVPVTAKAYKCGIHLSGNFSNVTVKSNLIVDSFAVQKIAYGIYENTNNLGSCSATGNRMNCAIQSTPLFFSGTNHAGAAWSVSNNTVPIFKSSFETHKSFSDGLWIVKQAGLFHAYSSLDGIKAVTISDIQGRKLVQGLIGKEGWFETPMNTLSQNVNIITISGQHGAVSQKILNF